MDTSSLRIGNIVQIMDRSLPIHMPITLVNFRIVGLSLGQVQLAPNRPLYAVEQYREVSSWDLVPVKLTEGWLKSLGFEKKKHVWSDKSVSEDYFWLGKYNVGIEDGYIFIGREQDKSAQWLSNIEYVHQLQNLYFALTQEELKFDVLSEVV